MKTKFLLMVLIPWLIISCSPENEPPNLTSYSINGVAQKGPFINGSQIEIFELDESLNQTGRSFTTEIINDLGEFYLPDIELESAKIEITANGYYYNEIQGNLSQSQLFLKSLSDLTDRSSVNVNILTHLIIDRIRTLINDNQDYKTAKGKAQNEFLKIFKIEDSILCDFEEMDIRNKSEQNGVLISISSIFQGNNTVAELSKLLADFKEDFGNDGTIDNANIQAKLIHNAQLIDTLALRNNLEKQYKNLGVEITVPVFEKYLQTFIDSTTFESALDISYPLNGKFGSNLLGMQDGAEINKDTEYSITASFPSDTHFFIRLKINVLNGNITWTTAETKQENWSGLPVNGEEIVGEAKGETADMPIIFTGAGKIEVQVETFKAGVIYEYIGTLKIELIIK